MSKHYYTPIELGVKWQMDVKYSYVSTDKQKFY